MGVVLFILGAALGSFLNVIALRYDPESYLFSKPVIGGRSKCDGCNKTLVWYELIPILSYLFQRGRCGKCGMKLSLQYPITELISGLIVFFIPYLVFAERGTVFMGLGVAQLNIIAFLLTLAFLALFLMSLIDRRLQIIPDEINIFLIVLAIFYIWVSAPSFVSGGGSFLRGYSLLFGFRENIWLNHILGSLVGGSFLLALFIITAGRGIGFGDVKLSFALGFLFGWPDIFLLQLLGFITGSIYGIRLLSMRKKKLKSFVPFGPFLALGSLLVFIWGFEILDGYFRLFSLR